jgi:hypothetical protein
MVKQHTTTGLKYLCITSRKNWQSYTGSGRHWRNHLQKHGVTFTTELLCESTDYDEFVEVCKYYSELYDVVNSAEFANAIPEAGYDNGGSKSNLEIFWDHADPELKAEIYKKRTDSLMKNGKHWSNSDTKSAKIRDTISKIHRFRWGNLSAEEREDFYQLYSGKHTPLTDTERAEISSKCAERYSQLTNEERNCILENMRLAVKKSKEFYANKDTERYRQHIEIKRKNNIERFNNMTELERAEHGKLVSAGRLAMSEDAKKVRGERIGEAFKKSEKRQKFYADMKVKRLGKNNPGAKIVLWMGTELTKSEFHKLKIPANVAEEMFRTRNDCIPAEPSKDDYETIVCPHCGKDSGHKKHSAFKRWHFDNCSKKALV